MNHADVLRAATQDINNEYYQEMLAAADRIDWLEDTTNEQVMRIEQLEAGREVEREMIRNAAARIGQLEAALRWYNDNCTVPGQVEDMGCGCCSRRVDVPEEVQAAWDSVTS